MTFDSPNVNLLIERYKSNCLISSRWNRAGIRSKRDRIPKQLLNESIGRSDIGADDKWNYHNYMCDWVNTFITTFFFNSSLNSITHVIVIIPLVISSDVWPSDGFIEQLLWDAISFTSYSSSISSWAYQAIAFITLYKKINVGWVEGQTWRLTEVLEAPYFI